MALQNLGVTRERPKAMPVTDKAPKKVKEWPGFELTTEHLAMVSKLQRGDKCTVTFECEVTGTQKGENWETPEKGARATFRSIRGEIERAGSHKTAESNPKRESHLTGY